MARPRQQKALGPAERAELLGRLHARQAERAASGRDLAPGTQRRALVAGAVARGRAAARGRVRRQGERPPVRVDRELFRQPSGRRASAGRVLGVGLVCFGLWTLLDANQLYHNALTSPFGTRRSAAIAVLRPIEVVANALRLSGPENAADSMLGREQTSSTLPPPPPLPPAAVSRPPNDATVGGVAPRPHVPGSVPPAERVWPPPVAQPTVSHPLVLLDIGDSIGEDLGYGLGDVFSGDHYVRLLEKAKIDTGLARPDFYNWPAELESYLDKYHPQAVVVMLGANDDQALEVSGERAVSVGTPEWLRLYKERIALMMDEATAAGAHVVWVGLPPMASPSVRSPFAEQVNSMVRNVAKSYSGVTVVPSWKILAGPHGRFEQYKTINGRVQQIRYSDGVHLAPAGWDLLASSLLGPMQKAWGIDLHARPIMKIG